ncbi:MAG: hypothetical protein JW885_03720 [Deltaproteobacteria bacterium]|nr:hypothetical protein [Candidatus Zymogenaceae bacterium]
MTQTKMRLGEFLVKNNIITQDELTQALNHQETRGGKLGNALISLNIISEDRLLEALKQHLKVPTMELENRDIPEDTLNTIPPKLVRKHTAVPVQIQKDSLGKNTLLLAMSNPMDINAIEEIGFATGMKVSPVLAKDSQIHALIRRYYEEDTNIPENNKPSSEKQDIVQNPQSAPGESDTNWQEKINSIPSLQTYGWDKRPEAFKITEQSEEMRMLFDLMDLLVKKGLVTEDELEEILSQYL